MARAPTPGFWVILVLLPLSVRGFYLQGSGTSYAMFPTWNACINATFSFEFKTTQSDGLLMYMDDSGRYDFFEVVHKSGRVSATLNIVDGRDGHVRIDVGRNVNDGKWHRLELRRNRMQTTLIVDGVSDSRFSFGSDFLFGNVANNSAVYFGGLPVEFIKNLHSLALPSVVLNTKRFKGSMRNILYNNCTCQTTRVDARDMLSGVGVNPDPPEACALNNPCDEECLCISMDEEPRARCDCSEQDCYHSALVHYQLPMDQMKGTTLINPSGLDAYAVGSPDLPPGIEKGAIRVDGKDTYVQVAGPGHRYECFGDLDKCNLGYTTALWVNFEDPKDGQAVYMSNGGHTPKSHGIAMLYDGGTLEFRFRRKNGEEWRVSSDDVIPNRYYHVAATWTKKDGLALYVDGDLVDTDISPTVRSPEAVTEDYPTFIIGKPNDGTDITEPQTMTVDEFEFWSMQKSPDEIKELGPLYCYRLSMDDMRGNEFLKTNLKSSVVGRTNQSPGKMGSAITLGGTRDFIDAGDRSGTCLTDLATCRYGMSLAMWVKFNELTDNSYIFSSGNKGIKVYYKDGELTAEAQQDQKNWKASWDNPQTGRWYYLEVSWHPEEGLRMLVDLDEVAHASDNSVREPQEGNTNVYVGRANTDMRREKFASVEVDELEMCYGDRERLIKFGVIPRGRPTFYNIDMDAISGRKLTNSDLDISLYNNPAIVPGKIGGALSLNGRRQYANLGDRHSACLGNIDRCRHGLLLASWIRPGQLSNGMQLMSTGSNGIRATYSGGKLKVSARTATKEWTASTGSFNPNAWQFLEFSWSKEKGLSIFINNQLVATSGSASSRTRVDSNTRAEQDSFYLGRGDGTDARVKYGNMTLDDFEYWFGKRDWLLAFDYIQRGKPTRYHFAMDGIRNNRLVHPSMDIPVFGNPRLVHGRINNAVQLDGNSQYIDIGRHADTCLGSPRECRHGSTSSMWVNFQRFEDNMYYYSSGDGVTMFYKNGKLHIALETANQRWELAVPELQTNRWYFVEYTWHPEKGLRVYLNDKLIGEATQPTRIDRRPSTGVNHVYVGRANPGDTSSAYYRFANMIVDDMESWYGHWDYLTAWGYLLRENITHLMIPFEAQEGNRVVQPGLDIRLHNDATLAPGVVGNALQLHGQGEYLTITGQGETCFGNLEKCLNGITMIFYLKPKRLDEGAYILSAGPYSMYYKNGKTHAVFSTGTNTWTVSTGDVQVDRWQRIDLSWEENAGLSMYVDNKMVASSNDYRDHPERRVTDDVIYLGRPNDQTVGGTATYADVDVDEMEVWYANRDHLEAFGLLDADVNRLLLTMDGIQNDMLIHSNRQIYVRGSPSLVRGSRGTGLRLNGVRQYVDAGPAPMCQGYLNKCTRGFTARFQVRPNQLENNMYFLSSAPYDIYYKDGRLYADFRTETERWVVSSPNINPSDWNSVDVTWDRQDGLTMYLNGAKVAHQRESERNRDDYDVERRLYVGRANTNMRNEKYLNAVVDDVELWEAKRSYLLGHGLLPGDISHIKLDMDEVEDNMLVHDTEQIYLHGSPTLVRGKHNNAIRLNGYNQYLDGGEGLICGGNLKNCPKGFTVRFNLKPNELRDKTYFVSSAPFDVYYDNGKMVADFRTPEKTWQVSAPGVDPGAWNLIEVTWDPADGLSIYVNGVKKDSMVTSRVNREEYDTDKRFYIGRANTRMVNERYFNGVVDDVELWEAKRSYLIGHGLIDEGVDEGSTPVYPTDIPIGPATPVPTGSTFPNGTVGPKRMLIFDGESWISYDLSKLPNGYLDENDKESFHLKFKTNKPNGLIWYSGTDQRNMHFSLKNGVPMLVIDYNFGYKVDTFRIRPPPNGRVDDNEWHNVWIERDGRNVVIKVDGHEFPKELRDTAYVVTEGGEVYLGGNTDPRKLTDGKTQFNFDGLVEEAVIHGDNMDTDLDLVSLYLQRPRPSIVTVDGNIDEGIIGEATQGVTFTRKEAYLRLNKWDAAKSGKISFKFRTVEPDGLMLYNGASPGIPDFIAVEMFDGIPYLVLDLGDGVHRYPFTEEMVNDGLPHYLELERVENYLKITLDGRTRDYLIASEEDDLDLGTFLFLGGVNNNNRLPWHLWSSKPVYYQGCIWDLQVNSVHQDLGVFVENQPIPGIADGCVEMPQECRDLPCVHGVCRDTWSGFSCDCAETMYTGERCEDDSRLVAFDGSEFVHIHLTPTMSSHVNDITLRFKTPKADGLLFSTIHDLTTDSLSASLENGRGKVEANIGSQIKTVYFCDDLNDDEWHTLHIRRRADHLEAWADDCEHSEVEIPGEGYTLDVDEIVVAAAGRNSDPEYNFVGHMQNFIYDGYRFFELLGPDAVIPSNIDKIDNTGEITDKEVIIPIHPATFRARTNAYITLAGTAVLGDLDIQFMFKTTEKDGIILYSEGRQGDYIAVELVDGFIHFSLDDGTGQRVIKVATPTRLDDDKWHQVHVKQMGEQVFQVHVDDTMTQLELARGRNRVELGDTMYVGGVGDEEYSTLPALVSSKKGFSGCLATFRVKGYLMNILERAISSSRFVTAGCTNSTSFCQSEVGLCQHGGTCLEGFSSFICDCNMTSFVGEVCTDEAEGYRYGLNNQTGILTTFFRPAVDTEEDRLAFGFRTWYPNGTFTRLDSGGSADFLEAKLVKGHIVVRYNVGNGVQQLIEDRQTFNDGQYHYVTYVRKGGNATLRVDDFPYTRISQKGVADKQFNELSVMRVGGNIDIEDNIYDYFNGILAGVYYNGYRLIDMGLGGDSRVRVTGDMIRAKHLFFLPRPVIVTDKPPVVTQPPVVIPSDGPIGPVGPGTPVPPVIPVDPEMPPGSHGGGGVAWKPAPDGNGLVVGAEPGGGGVGMNAGAGGGSVGQVVSGGGGGGGGAVAAARSGGAGVGTGGSGEVGRAGAVAGAFIGVLAAASSIMWAVYKFKPGLIPLGGGGGGGGGGGAMNISSPRAASNYQLVKSQSVGGPGTGMARAGGGGGAGGGYAFSKMSANGTAGGGSAVDGAAIPLLAMSPAAMSANAGTQTLLAGGHSMTASEYYAASSSSGGAASGLVAGAGAVSRAAQTDLAYSGLGAGYAMSSRQMSSSSTMAGGGYSESMLAGGGSGFSETSFMQSSSSAAAAGGGAAYGGGAAAYGGGSRMVCSEGTQTLSRADAGTGMQGDTVMQGQAISSSYMAESASYSQSMQNGYAQNGQAVQTMEMGTQSAGAGAGGGGGGGYGDTMSNNYQYKDSRSYSASTADSRMNTSLSPGGMADTMSNASYRMQMHNMPVVNAAASNGPNLYAQSAQSAQGAGGVMAAEEIRVDCVLLTSDGRYVVTGSIFGPPQVWDLKSGELVRMMYGEDLSSTDLHLACDDKLLVGQMAEMTKVDPSDVHTATKLHHRKLQIWDFETGRPLEMAKNELCTASCMTNDSRKVVLGRTGKFGNGTSIVIWDLMGNEPVRQIKYDNSIGFADYISYLNLSKDSRYVVAGFQNSYDGNANFIIFDLTADNYNEVDPKIIAFDAQAEVTAVLDSHEAITGTKRGELTIWSMRTGKPLRQLLMPPGGAASMSRKGVAATSAHTREVNALEVSRDGIYLVSGSADATLKVWHMETEKLMHTLKGHKDEVLCCCISNDNDLVVSGSRDCSIRVWRLQTAQAVCAFNTGVDVFTVKLTNNKQTVVALGDKQASRKLIMLKVVTTKVKSRAGSRATSPLSPEHYPAHLVF